MSVRNTGQNNTGTAEMPAISHPTTIGRYQVIRTLGSGGMGEVLLCHDPQSEKDVAIKSVDLASAQRLQVEAEGLAKIEHPNIVRYIDSDFSARPGSASGPYIAMEYIEGYSLLHLIRARRLTIIDILEYTIQLLTGLEAIHRSGFLHRDLKSANIMIDNDGRLKIIDFGIAQPHRHGNGIQVRGPSGPLTTHGHIIGTMNYMAPEILGGERASTSTDLYSVGVIVWEMIHHRLPFSTCNRDQVAQNVIKQNLEWSPAVGDFLPDGLIPLISRILSKTADKRPALNTALIDELKKMVLGLRLPEPLRQPCPTNKTHRRPVFDKNVLARNSIADVELPYLALVRDNLRAGSTPPTDQDVVIAYLTLKKSCADARGERIKRRLLESRGLANPGPITWQRRLHAALIPVTIGAMAFTGVGLLRYLDSSFLSRSRLTGVPLYDIVRSRGLRARGANRCFTTCLRR
ncbi:MAG: serine/threonine protein kinase [Bdellovibrionales bacterium]|nr:serine/threonine protein kinase [Bdellovibrionales bacterium]